MKLAEKIYQTLKQKTMSTHFSYYYAYDEFGNYVSLFKASELSHRKWYLDRNKQIELKPYFNNKVQSDHWRALPSQYINIKGERKLYNADKECESKEHKLAKGKIIDNGYFWYKRNKIIITDAREEVSIEKGKYRWDVHAKLGNTDVVIEIIKTSDLSENKEIYIKENQILTFKIHIDESGMQISSRDCIIGNNEIEQINKRIQDGEGKIAEIRGLLESENQRQKKKLIENIQRFDEYLQERTQEYNFRNRIIEGEKRDLLGEIKDGRSGAQREITSYQEGITSTKRDIESVEGIIQRIGVDINDLKGKIRKCGIQSERIRAIIERYEDEISRNRNKCLVMEKTFSQLAERCKIEWYRNKWMTAPIQNKLQELKYWTS